MKIVNNTFNMNEEALHSLFAYGPNSNNFILDELDKIKKMYTIKIKKWCKEDDLWFNSYLDVVIDELKNLAIYNPDCSFKEIMTYFLDEISNTDDSYFSNKEIFRMLIIMKNILLSIYQEFGFY